MHTNQISLPTRSEDMAPLASIDSAITVTTNTAVEMSTELKILLVTTFSIRSTRTIKCHPALTLQVLNCFHAAETKYGNISHTKTKPTMI